MCESDCDHEWAEVVEKDRLHLRVWLCLCCGKERTETREEMDA